MCPRSGFCIRKSELIAYSELFCSIVEKDFSEEISVRRNICQKHPFGNNLVLGTLNSRNGPNTVSESTVSNTELSELFGSHRAPGRERTLRRTHRVCRRTQLVLSSETVFSKQYCTIQPVSHFGTGEQLPKPPFWKRRSCLRRVLIASQQCVLPFLVQSRC